MIRFVRVGADVFGALDAACRRALDEAAGAVAAPNVLAECLTRTLYDRTPPRLASVVPHPRQEWRSARLDVIPSGAAAAEALAALRESGWRAAPGVLDWDSSVLIALRTALVGASQSDVGSISTAHLAAALLRDPEVRTQDVLSPLGTDRQSVLRDVETSGRLARTAVPWAPGVDFIRGHGGTADQPWFRQVLHRPGHQPVVAALGSEAARHAVRLGHGVVEPVHLFVAAVALQEQLTATGTALPDRVQRRCTFAARLFAALAPGQNPATLAADLVESPATLGSAAQPGPTWSQPARVALDGATAGRGRWLRPVGSDDVLSAVVDDGAAQRFVSRCHVDPTVLSDTVRAHGR